jgi:hypothetical protein
MTTSAKRKCLHCQEFFRPDHRNLHQQRYCSKFGCRRQSKAESQRRWLQKPENQNYFRGPDNCQRVKDWRKCHPGYRCKKKSGPEEPLQEVCRFQATQSEELSDKKVPHALQDLLEMQPLVIVGLISTMTGSALQEDIAATKPHDCSRLVVRSCARPAATSFGLRDRREVGAAQVLLCALSGDATKEQARSVQTHHPALAATTSLYSDANLPASAC